MGCGCRGRKKKQETTSARSEWYTTNGNQETVRLGLRSRFFLPLRLPNALDGKDIIVVGNKKRVPANDNAIIIVGRNAQVLPEHKAIIAARWPHAFEGT